MESETSQGGLVGRGGSAQPLEEMQRALLWAFPSTLTLQMIWRLFYRPVEIAVEGGKQDLLWIFPSLFVLRQQQVCPHGTACRAQPHKGDTGRGIGPTLV